MFASSPERGSFLRGVLALSVKPCRACQLSQRESPWQCGKVSGSSAKFAGVSAPPGGAVAQRLRGFKSAEPEKTVKRSSRRTGVNLQFFPVEPTSLGSSRASSPWPVAGWVESRGREGGVGTPLPASGPAERPCALAVSRNFPRGARRTFLVLFWCQKRTFLGKQKLPSRRPF